MPIPQQVAISYSGATQIFILEGTPVTNKHTTTCPLKVALANGRQVLSTHICDVDIPGLPVTLVGHIIPDLSIASLFGIRVLTDVGCTVSFDVNKCVVYFKGCEILRGYKDPTPDLWTLPLGNTTRASTQHDPVMSVLACPKLTNTRTCYSPHKGQQHQICPSSVLQSSDIYLPQSNLTRVPQRVPKSHLNRCHPIPES